MLDQAQDHRIWCCKSLKDRKGLCIFALSIEIVNARKFPPVPFGATGEPGEQGVIQKIKTRRSVS